jgi:hypothetical protein
MYSLQPTILNDNVNQFKVGLESDKGYFTFFARNSTYVFYSWIIAVTRSDKLRHSTSSITQNFWS